MVKHDQSGFAPLRAHAHVICFDACCCRTFVRGTHAPSLCHREFYDLTAQLLFNFQQLVRRLVRGSRDPLASHRVRHSDVLGAGHVGGGDGKVSTVESYTHEIRTMIRMVVGSGDAACTKSIAISACH